MTPSPLRLFAPAALALLTAGFSAVAAQPPGHEGRVTVSGLGEIRIAPDMAMLTVEASNNSGSPLDASNDTRKDMNQIVVAARKGVKDTIRDLRTTRISVNPEYEWVEGKRKDRGYTATQTLEITVKDVSKIEILLEALLKAPVYTLGNLEFRHSKADSLRREAGALAIKDAGENARNLCGAVKRSCEELLAARMAGTTGPAPFPAAEFKAMRADAGGGMPVQPGTLTFSAMVEADYRLKRDAGSASEKEKEKAPAKEKEAAEEAAPAPSSPSSPTSP
jgi:uncharacterized protein YggE